MPLGVPRMLIVDDKEEDGIRIAKSIWDSKYSVRFIRYDPEVFLKSRKENIKGVRVIFMDIDLIGDGVFTSGSKNFSAVQQVLQYCLDERNGPYVLITWSTYDQHADELFQHLQERMPGNLKPALCKRLNKEDYKNGGGNLTEKIEEYMHSLEATGCLIEWEKSIQYAACETICELIDIASGLVVKDTKHALKSVLYSLAAAEAEQNLEKANAVTHLYSILSRILCDEVLNELPANEEACSDLIYSGKDMKRDESWHQRINAMLHLDFTESAPYAGHVPGDVFKYPEQGHGIPIPEENVSQFLRGRFMSFESGEEKKKYKPDIENNCQLLLVEITPPCDYSQKKFVWHRYIIAALIPKEFIFLVRVLNRRENKREDRLPDFCWSSPEFQTKNPPPFTIFFNSRLIVSIPPKEEFQKKLGKRLFRIRQPLLSDMIGWLARQSSRLGHVSVSS